MRIAVASTLLGLATMAGLFAVASKWLDGIEVDW